MFPRIRARLVENVHILIGFLPVCCMQKLLLEKEGAEDKVMLLYRITISMTVLLEIGVWLNAASQGRQWRIRVLQEVIKAVVGPWQNVF